MSDVDPASLPAPALPGDAFLPPSTEKASSRVKAHKPSEPVEQPQYLREPDSWLGLLLSLSGTFATVRNRKELFATILEKIKPVLPVDDTGLLVLDKTGRYWQDWTNVDNYQGAVASATLQQLGYDGFLPIDRWMEYTLHHTGIITLAQFQEQYPEHPFGAVMWEAGLREMMFTPLVNGGKKLGVLFFDSGQEGTYNEHQVPLFKAVADLVAIAVANILANEEILEREREKLQLLEITQLIAQVKATNDLLRLIMGKIKPLLRFYDCGLFVVSPDGKTHSDLAAVLPEVSPSAWNQAIAAVSVNVAHSGSPVEWMMQQLEDSGRPVLADFEELVERFPDYPQFKGMDLLTIGYRDCLAASLTVRGKSIGFFCINALRKDFFTADIFPLFQSVTHTISIAVANIMAHEEIVSLQQQLQQENVYLAEEIKQTLHVDEMIGSSRSLSQVFHQMSLVAPTDSAVLILGETGTGKELLARAIHERSSRKGKVLVKVNCAALPKELIESELFGHEKGAFTGAIQQRIGKFELAKEGTLFLDEIGELPLELQAKLLRVLQEKQIERLGSNKTIHCNVRIVAATNRDLEQEVAQGRFRMDLYYRLNVFPLYLPPLRERKEDIPLLASYFGQQFSQKLGKPFRGIKQKAMQELLAYHWPGNIRELENLVEQAVILSQGAPLEWARKLISSSATLLGSTGSVAEHNSVPAKVSPLRQLQQRQQELKREQILSALSQTKGRIRGEQGAAKLLGLKPTTLEYHIQKLGLEEAHYRMRKKR